MTRRSSILQAAKFLLLEHGAGGLTVAAVAKKASVGVGTVYLEFRSKDQILQELSGECHEQVLRQMRRAAMRATDANSRWRGVMNARLDTFIALYEAHPAVLDLLDAPECEGVMHAARGFEQAQRELWIDMLEEGVEAGEFRPFVDVSTQVDTLRVLYVAFEPPALFALDPARVLPLHERAHEVVLHGLCRSGAKRGPAGS